LIPPHAAGLRAATHAGCDPRGRRKKTPPHDRRAGATFIRGKAPAGPSSRRHARRVLPLHLRLRRRSKLVFLGEFFDGSAENLHLAHVRLSDLGARQVAEVADVHRIDAHEHQQSDHDGDRKRLVRDEQSERGATDGEESSLLYRAYRLGENVHSDMELIRRRDGHLVPVALTCSARPEGGAVLVLRDIGAWLEHEEDLRHTREEMESQRQSMAHMERLSTSGEMAAGIAHEVNQPLTAVVNYARVGKRLLERGDLDRDKLMDILSKVDTQAVRASDVIQRLRSYVKKPDIGRSRVDLNILMQEVFRYPLRLATEQKSPSHIVHLSLQCLNKFQLSELRSVRMQHNRAKK